MESRLVPEVFSNLEYTNKCLNVEFEKGAKVERGNTMPLSSLNKLPHISWDANEFKFYTVAVFDPDASSVIDPNRECLQFLAYNVKGNNINSGKTFAEWLPPTLSKEKPRHRLVFAVYEQQGEIYPVEKPLSNECLDRCEFHLQDWRRKYNLSNPIALNYFESEFDENQPHGTGIFTQLVEGIQSGAHYLGEKMQAGYETVREGMHELRERVHEKKEELRHLAEEKKEQIKEGAQDLKEDFQEKKEEIKQDFQEKKAEVRDQPNIDFRQGVTSTPETTVGFPPVQRKIEIFEKGVQQQETNLPVGSYESLSTGQRTIPTQPVISTTTTQPVETQPSVLTNIKENLQAGVHTLGENLQAGYEVAKEKVASGLETIKENLQAGAGVVKENLQAGYEVAKEKVASGIETIKEGAINAKEDLKTGMQTAKENVQAGFEVAKEKVQYGAQKIGETFTPTTTTTTTTTTSFTKPTFSPSSSSSSTGSVEQFPSESDQIERFEKLNMNEDSYLQFLNESKEPAPESMGLNTPFGGDQVDIAIAKDSTPSSSGFNQPSMGGFDQPSGINYNPNEFNQPSTGFNQPSFGTGFNQPSSTFSSSDKKPESKI